jgi:hypothetical protein
MSGWLLLAGAGPGNAQTLVSHDDGYPVPYGESLVVEAFGVLDNDTLDGENAGESGATVGALVVDVSYGTLVLTSPNGDGSFTYTPGPGFSGSDSFVYRAVAGSASAEATVTLTACGGGPQVFTCWKEDAFLAKSAALGHPRFQEGFEDDAVWGALRSPFTALSVSSRGVEWRANEFDPTHTDPNLPPPPPPNEITTGSGASRTGQWGIFDPEHGYATGTSTACDIDSPKPYCHPHDGFTIIRPPGSSPLHGAGGFFHGTHGANVAVVLDGDYLNPIGGGQLSVGVQQFFGVIGADPNGFAQVQFRETDGKLGQLLLIFGDDFTLLAEPSVPATALDGPRLIALALLLASAVAWYLSRSYAGDQERHA